MTSFKRPQMVPIIHHKPDITLKITMIHIPKGTFTMGEGSDAKDVEIKQDFELGKYPVTIAQYKTFVDDTHSHYPKWLEKGSNYHIGTGSDDYYKKMDLSDAAPIIGISWHDARAYCQWLSKRSGDLYRLPSEAEWEYAARAGTTTKWSFGDDEKELDEYAWYSKNSDGKTHPVGGKKPNPWGLHDMHGNVWEWCEDWYDQEQNSKVIRGGSWFNGAGDTRSSFRSRDSPGDRSRNIGFRLLRTLPS